MPFVNDLTESRRIDWRALPVDQADQLAWKAICEWPQEAGFQPVFDGIDYSLLSRSYLRHKVARSIRKIRDADNGRFEDELIDRRGVQIHTGYKPRAWWVPGDLWEWLKRPLRPIAGRIPGVTVRKPGTPHKATPTPGCDLYVPLAHARWNRTLSALQSTGLTVFIDHDPWEDATRVDRRTRRDSKRWARRFVEHVERGLAEYSVILAHHDISTLIVEMNACKIVVDIATETIETTRPSVMITFADDHSPSMEYVLAARYAGIPTLMIQHGLDCETLTLDEAYADHIAVWGPERRDRYSERSRRQPQSIEVTGNPEFDLFPFPETVSPFGSNWLWVTRPHASNKCYLPSRSTREGVDLLTALLDLVQSRPTVHLKVKPHPFDYSDIYSEMIASRQLEDRVSVVYGPLSDLLAGASCVFSEDSTAGMEAMFAGKPLVHVHFAPTPPSMPFVEYGAALPAFDEPGLRQSVAALEGFRASDYDGLLSGQRDFLRAYAGPNDGGAMDRISRYVTLVARNDAHSRGSCPEGGPNGPS